MPQFFDPGQAMNAFASGAQMGGAIRSQQTSNALAPMVAKGDLKGAMDYAGQRGDLGQVQDMKSQYAEQIKQMSDQDKAAAQKRAQDLARVALSVKQTPYEQRKAIIQQNIPMLQAMGMDPAAIQGFDPTDQGLQMILNNATELEDLMKTQVVADGAQVWQGGQMVGENPKDAPPPKYDKWEDGTRRMTGVLGDPSTYSEIGTVAPRGPLVSVSTGDMPTKKNLSPFQVKQDEIYAGQLAEWNTGGASDAAKGIDQMKAVSERLRSGEDLTGFLMGMTPDFVARGLNPNSVDTRELAEEVVQRNLRIILGAQFTAKEGERLIARAYNKGLSEKMNAERIDRLVQAMDGRAQQMKSLNEYATKYGTSAGWDGSLATVDDLLDAMDGQGGGRNAPAKGQESTRFPSQVNDPEVDALMNMYGDN